MASGLILADLDVELAIATAGAPTAGERPALPSGLSPTSAQRSRTRSELELAALMNPTRPERAPWRTLYGPELTAAPHAGVALDLASQNPVAAIARRAKLTPAETDVFRAWAAGSSLRTIARDLRRQPRTVRTLLERARERLRGLDRRGFVAHPPTESSEEPCSPAEPTSPQTCSPGSSAMPVAS